MTKVLSRGIEQFEKRAVWNRGHQKEAHTVLSPYSGNKSGLEIGHTFSGYCRWKSLLIVANLGSTGKSRGFLREAPIAIEMGQRCP
jgi:hypothetical protein